jgi:HD-GYP domain-containing protein (c-di-GMP phosphodiesterase class II)
MSAIFQHHERYDGKGYPQGLSGENITLGARILNVADTIDAMVSERPYRGIISSTEVVQELEKESGRQFDPRVAESAKQLIEKGLLKLGMQTYYHYATGTEKNAHGHKNAPDKV